MLIDGMNHLKVNAAYFCGFLIFTSILCLIGCRNRSSKLLPGGYVLDRFSENGMCYLMSSYGDSSGGGILDGTVDEIGWNSDWILAHVVKLYHGDTNGWYALNVKTGKITGPIEDTQLRTNSELSVLTRRKCADVISGKGN